MRVLLRPFISYTMNFQDYIQDFTSVTVEQAQSLLTAQEGGILFIGRATCPYCNRFAPKLHKVAQDKQVTVHFLDSSQISPELQTLRDHYQVPTVPGLLVAKPTGVQVRCDSSMTEEEIAAFIEN
ncbi:conjugal transfer protein TraF [Streptococcus suis]|nr:conjugal transfer protein TraF [Streptococcus suis]HEM5502859.1 conjugal transfer protein TraF [Streptococcus suis]